MQYQQSKQQTLASNYWAQKRPWYTTLEIHIFLVWDRYNCFTYMRYRLIEPKHRRSIIVLIVTNQYLRPTILFYKICNLHKWTTPDLRVVIIKWLTMFFLNEMTFLCHLSSNGEAPEMWDYWDTSSSFQKKHL